MEGPLYGGSGTTKDDESFIFSQMRLGFNADLTDNVEANIRLLNERVWGAETNSGSGNTSVDLDLAYLKMKDFLGYPVSLKIGRQNLHFGNGLIVGDPDTNVDVSSASGLYHIADSYSLRKAFDAVRATFDFNPVVVDLIYSKVKENATNERDDVTLYGFNAQYLPNDNDVYELYTFVKENAETLSTETDVEDSQDYVIAVGSHMEKELNDNFVFNLEVAHQFGDYRGYSGNSHAKRDAWAVQSGLDYKFQDKAHSMLGLWLTYLSGDADHYNNGGEGSLYTKWDPMFEDQTGGDIVNLLLTNSNTYNIGLNYFTFLSKQLRVLAKYNHTRLVKNHYSSNYIIANGPAYLNKYKIDCTSKHLGDEIDVHLTYDYSENTHFVLKTGFFLPGGLLTSANDNPAYLTSLAAKIDF